MKPETKLAQQQAAEASKQACQTLGQVMPSYISERDQQILLDSAFYTERETAEMHKVSHGLIQHIKHKYRDTHNKLVGRKQDILVALNHSLAYAAASKVRDYVVDPAMKVERVSDASQLASVATQAAKVAVSLAPKADSTPPTDWAKLAASTPASMQPTTSSGQAPIPPPNKSES